MTEVNTGTKKTEEKKCKLCGSVRLTIKYSLGGYDYLKCKDCEVVFQDQNFSKSDISDIYNNGQYLSKTYKYNNQDSEINSYFAKEDGRRQYASQVIGELKKVFADNDIKIGKKILDIGCAAGFFLDVARTSGFEPYGIELSQEGADYAREKLGIDVIANDLLAMPEKFNGTFDLVTLFDVLEHLDDPAVYLKKVNQALKPDGVLVIEVPNIKTIDRFVFRNLVDMLQPPHHLFVFSPDNLRAILERSGFQIIVEKLYFSNLLGGIILKVLSFLKLRKTVNEKINESKVAEIFTDNSTNSHRSGFISQTKAIVQKFFPGSRMRFVCVKIDPLHAGLVSKN